MKQNEARIIVLEAELNQAYHTIEFLHGCLTDNSYLYSYPEQTEERLAKIKELITVTNGCYHSHNHKGCSQCQESKVQRNLLNTATKTLAKYA